MQSHQQNQQQARKDSLVLDATPNRFVGIIAPKTKVERGSFIIAACALGYPT